MLPSRVTSSLQVHPMRGVARGSPSAVTPIPVPARPCQRSRPPPLSRRRRRRPEPPQGAAPAQPAPIFKAGVELVRLDVRVVDDRGVPVKDLEAEEVKVFEGSTERPVVLFQHVAEPEGTYLEVARRTIGAEVSTNQGAPRGHLYLVVFDQNHITARQRAARAPGGRAVPSEARQAGRSGRALRAARPRPAVPFSSNVNMALAELPKVRGSLDREGFAVGTTMTDFEAYQINNGDPSYLQRFLNRVASTCRPAATSRGPEPQRRHRPPTRQTTRSGSPRRTHGPSSSGWTASRERS